MPKRTKEQKEKFRGKFKKVTDRIMGGDLEKGAIVATRFVQGKPVVLKRNISKEDEKKIPKEIIIFGIPIKTTHAVIGGTILISGTIFVISKMRK